MSYNAVNIIWVISYNSAALLYINLSVDTDFLILKAGVGFEIEFKIDATVDTSPVVLKAVILTLRVLKLDLTGDAVSAVLKAVRPIHFVCYGAPCHRRKQQSLVAKGKLLQNSVCMCAVSYTHLDVYKRQE